MLPIDTPLFVYHRISQETGGDELVLRSTRQQVARELLDDELVIGQVAVESVEDPAAIEPDLAGLVLFETVGVGVACGVEPGTRPALAVVRRRQQPIDE